MGIFDLFRKKEITKESNEEIWNIRDLNNRITSLEKQEFENFYTEIERIRNELGLKLTNLKNSVSALEKSKLSSDIDKKLIIKIESSKQNLINRTKNSCDLYFERKLKPVDNMENLNKLLDVVSNVFDEINNGASKYCEIVSYGYNSSIGEVKRGIKESNNLYKRLIALSKDNRGKLESINEIKEALIKINSNLIKIDELHKELECLRKKIHDCKEKVIELSNKKEKIEGSNSYKDALAMKDKISSLITEKEFLRIDFRNEFSSFKKPLQKYLHYSLINKDISSKIGKYLDEPLDALINDSNMEIESALSKILILIKENKIEFEKKSRTKLYSEFEKFLSAKRLHSVIAKYNELEREILSLRNEISKSIIDEHEQIIKELSNIKKEIASDSTRLEMTDKEVLDVENRIKSITAKIESDLKSNFNKEIKIY